MELLFSSLGILARWDVLAALVIGSVGGVIIGAIPGVAPRWRSPSCCLPPSPSIRSSA